MLEKFIENHKFFVKISPSFMEGTPRLEYYLRYPIVYLKFMYSMMFNK
jgi:hypothetical protein